MMNLKKLLLCCLLILVANPIVAWCETKSVSVRLYDGSIVQLGLDDGMPAPSENDFMKILMVGVASSKPKDPSDSFGFRQSFGFQNKSGQKLKQVKVEEVFLDKPDELIYVDAKPSTSKGFWSYITESSPVSKELTPWVFDERDTISIFRFTVEFENGDKTSLYQMRRLTGVAKTLMFK